MAVVAETNINKTIMIVIIDEDKKFAASMKLAYIILYSILILIVIVDSKMIVAHYVFNC